MFDFLFVIFDFGNSKSKIANQKSLHLLQSPLELGDQRGWLKWLGQIGICPQLAAAPPASLVVQRGDENDRDAFERSSTTQFFVEVKTRDVGQHQIEQNGGRPKLRSKGEGVTAFFDPATSVSFPLEQLAQQLVRRGLILHDQDRGTSVGTVRAKPRPHEAADTGPNRP